MIDFEQALSVAKKVVAEYQRKSTHPLVLLEEMTITFQFGWVFFWTAEAIANGTAKFRMGGNAPFIIDKFTGNLTETGTRREIEYYIDLYTNFMVAWRS
jgi:hypothetical protein